MKILFHLFACLGRPAWLYSWCFVFVSGKQFVQFGGLQHTDPPGTVLVKLAGTLTLSGLWRQQRVLSQEMLHGFYLFAARVNNEGIFSSDPLAFAMPNGSAIRIKVLILDDEGSTNLVAQLYSQMMLNNTADLYLAPCGSWKSYEAATQSENASKVIMATAGDISVYNSSFLYAFSTTPTADTYMKEALNLVHSTGASHYVIVVYRSGCHGCHSKMPSRFYDVACQHAHAHATQLGFQFVSSDTFMNIPVALGSFLKATHQPPGSALAPLTGPPDAVLACGYVDDVYNLMGTFRSENARPYKPNAMIWSHATNHELFIDPLGPANVNYLMGPVSWHQHLADGNICALFGSAGQFAEKFRQMFPGRNVTDHSASAAAGLYALLAAVARLGGTVPTSEIRRELLELNLRSFYGRLRFTNSGTLANKTWLTEQVKPLSVNYSRMDRFRKSDVMYVGDHISSPFLYPMPAWEQKLAEVFPCDPGAELSNKTRFATCKLCEIGRFRSYGTACLPCGSGSYSNVEGSTACKSCPVGAQCGGATRQVGIPLAEAGYYKLPYAFRYLKCETSSACLEGNVCQSPNSGFFCKNCVSGFTKTFARGKPCKKCPALIWIFAKAVMVFVFMSTVLVGGLEHITQRESRSIKVIFAIILKKIVNHLQLCATAWLVCDIDLAEGIRTLSTAIQDPFGLFVELDCIEYFQGTPHELRVLIGLFLIPVGLSLQAVVFYTRLTFRVESFFLEASVTKKKIQKHEAHLTQLAQDDKDNSSDSGSNSDGPPKDDRKLKWSLLQESHTSLKAWRIIFLFVFHPIVMSLLLDGISCIEVDVQRLEKNLDVQCKSDNFTIWVALGIVGLVVYGFGIPIVLNRMLWGQRHKLHNLPVRDTYGFLYNGFELDYYYFEIVHMFRNVAFLCWCRLMSDFYTRIAGLFCLSMAFLAVQIAFCPHDKRDYSTLDRLETTSLLSVSMIIQFRLFSFLRAEIQNSSPRAYDFFSHYAFDGVLVFCCAFFQLWFWKLVLMNCFRSFILKQVHLKSSCIPEKLSDFQRVLLLLEPHMNFLKLRPGSHELDLSSLTRKERRFVLDALCATLQLYIESDRHFHPGRIVSAARRAFHICVENRSARVQQLIFDLDHPRMSKSCFERTKRKVKQICRPCCMRATPAQPTEKVMSAKEIIERRERLEPELCHEDPKCTVEDFLNALMLCWPEIKENRQRLYVMDKASLSVEEQYDQKGSSSASIHGSSLFGIDSVVARAETQQSPKILRKLATKDVAGLLANSTKRFDTRTEALRRRRGDQLQEMWLMEAEVAALRGHLKAVREPLSRDGWKDDEESLVPVKKSRCKSQSIAHQKEYADDISKVLRGIHREREAMEVAVLAARLTAIKTVWEIAHDAESKCAAYNRGDVENKVIVLLREKQGVELFKNTAAKSVTELRMIAAAIRKDGFGVEGNQLEAIAFKFSKGLISEEELFNVTKKVAGTSRASLHKEADSRRRSLASQIPASFKSRSSNLTKDLQGDEVLKRAADLVEHLFDLHRKHEARTVAIMAHRLIELRDFRRQNKGEELSSDVVPKNITTSGDVLKVLKRDPNWQQMGPLAAEALKQLGQIRRRLQNSGLPVESNDVDKLADELAVGLVTDVPLLRSAEATTREGD